MACRAEKLEAIAQKKVHGTQLRLSMVLENQTYWRIKIVWYRRLVKFNPTPTKDPTCIGILRSSLSSPLPSGTRTRE